MAGHSHSANIARRKGDVDGGRAKVFSKMARAVIIAARHGGGDPDANLDLRYAIDRARAVSMPKDNIERAVKKGCGELEGAAQIESAVFEAVGPGGALMMIDVLTDNRNRTAPELRKILERRNASTGSTAWAFERKGVIVVPAADLTEDRLLEVVLDADAEDLQRIGDRFEIVTQPASLETVRVALTQAGIAVQEAGLTQVAKNPLDLDEETTRKLLSLIDDLNDHEDVQNVHTNVNIPEAMLAEQAG